MSSHMVATPTDAGVEHLLLHLFDRAPDAIVVARLSDGRVVMVNDACCELAGRDRANMIGRTAEEIGLEAEIFRAALMRALEDKSALGPVELEIPSPSDESIWLEYSAEGFMLEGEPHAIAFLRDVTDRVAAAAAIRAERDHSAALVAALGDGLVEADRDGRLVDVNDRFCEMVGLTRDEVLAVTDVPYPWWPPEHADELARIRAEVLTSTDTALREFEGVFQRRDGERFPVQVIVAPVSAPDGTTRSVLRIFRDVTRQKRAEERLAHAAAHDPLTDLANRRLLVEELDAALARARRAETGVALLFLDLDGFKRVNDTFGHAAGDRVLVEAARRLREAARAGETVARLHGDEFVVVCEDLRTDEQVEAVRERFAAALAYPHQLAGRDVDVPASIGAALSFGDTTPERLLRDADASMYRSKSRKPAAIDLTESASAYEPDEPRSSSSATELMQ